jgi:hypothetical protein
MTGVLLLVAFAADLSAQGGYGGPSMLSRGGNRPGRRGRAPVDFNFYLGARGTAEQGLLRPSLTSEGELDPITAYGGSAEAGLYGGHDWRRSSFGVDYRGDYRVNTRNSAFNGFNQAVSLEFMHQVNRRTSFFVSETGGTSNRAFGGFAAPAGSELDRQGVPLNEVYDVRTLYSQTQGGVSYRKSARTTLAAQGSAFFTKRRNASLINGQGYGGGVVASHRMSRATEVGVLYQFTRFEFPRVYGGSSVHSVGLTLNRSLNRSWSVALTAGILRVHSKGTQEVQLSPEVAFILGRSTGLSAFSQVSYRPLINVTTSYTQERGRFTASFLTGVANGNGIYQTTQRDAVHAGYSYSGLRRMSVGVSAGYTRTSSVAVDLVDLNSAQAGGGLSYQIMPHLSFTSQLDYRTFKTSAVRGREGFSATVGLSYTSSSIPLAIW